MTCSGAGKKSVSLSSALAVSTGTVGLTTSGVSSFCFSGGASERVPGTGAGFGISGVDGGSGISGV